MPGQDVSDVDSWCCRTVEVLQREEFLGQGYDMLELVGRDEVLWLYALLRAVRFYNVSTVRAASCVLVREQSSDSKRD